MKLSKSKAAPEKLGHLMNNVDLIKNMYFDDKKAQKGRTGASRQPSRTEAQRSPSPMAKSPQVQSSRASAHTASKRGNPDQRERSLKSSTMKAINQSSQQLYSEINHGKPQGYYYDSRSTKVPKYYNRVGPGSYHENQTIGSDPKLERLAKHSKSPGQVIGQQDFPKGSYTHTVAHHRFMDYSKSLMHSEILMNANSLTM